jgi:hypothetical protein
VATGGDDRSPTPASPRDLGTERRSDERRSDERRSDERSVAADTGQPPGVTGGIVSQPRTGDSSQEPKKRGFWGRIFKRR